MTDSKLYKESVVAQIELQRTFFATGTTRNINYRKESLKRLHKAITDSEKEIAQALHNDLRKSPQEAYLCETGIVLSELKFHIRNLIRWAKPQKVATPLFLAPSRSYTRCEPFGVTLVLAPWNYPFQLLINPLIAAVSAGNCVIAKPSPFTPHTNRILQRLLQNVFDPRHVCLIEGDSPQTQFILSQPFDFIFFTGSTAFGREVMQAAARHLTPVVLELGGKSPCIVDLGCDLDMAAKRIVWGKLLNAGQTCVAPDYVWVHRPLEKELIKSLIKYIQLFYGNKPMDSPFYPKIIHNRAYERLVSYLNDGTIAFGGEIDEANLQISPTILTNVSTESSVMQEEIFGPILPLLSFDRIEEVITDINSRPKALALYYFGKEKMGRTVIQNTTSGGVCINDVLLHLSNHNLPFGGVGASGIGKYHGKHGFKAFSNERALLVSSTKIDFFLKYVPFRFFSLVKKLL